MPTSYITIPRSEYEGLVRELRSGIEVCGEIGGLRLKLQALGRRLYPICPKSEDPFLKELDKAIERCEEVQRLRVELSAFERRLREFDQDLTPVRPPSRMDIQQAFKNAEDFASGKKKPPGA